jgi:uncharacterized protein (TIGR02246 family)
MTRGWPAVDDDALSMREGEAPEVYLTRLESLDRAALDADGQLALGISLALARKNLNRALQARLAGLDRCKEAIRQLPEAEREQLALQALNERWIRAWFEKDAATVERLMADDYVYVGPGGLVLDRRATLAVIRSPSYRLDHGTRTDVLVRAVGQDAAVVRHRWQGAGSFEGKPFTDDYRGVMVWEKQAGEWRVVMEQCSFTG